MVILGHFFALLPHKTPKNQDFKKGKKLLEISFYTYVPEIILIWCMVSEIWSAKDRIFCHYGLFFLPFCPSIDPENQNFEKNEKNTWRYYHFTNVYHKWQSYDKWFFRYGLQQTKIFCNFGPFLALLSPTLTNLKMKILKNWKNPWKYHYFTQVYQKSWSCAILFLRMACSRFNC